MFRKVYTDTMNIKNYYYTQNDDTKNNKCNFSIIQVREKIKFN